MLHQKLIQELQETRDPWYKKKPESGRFQLDILPATWSKPCAQGQAHRNAPYNPNPKTQRKA